MTRRYREPSVILHAGFYAGTAYTIYTFGLNHYLFLSPESPECPGVFECLLPHRISAFVKAYKYDL